MAARDPVCVCDVGAVADREARELSEEDQQPDEFQGTFRGIRIQQEMTLCSMSALGVGCNECQSCEGQKDSDLARSPISCS